MTGKCKGFGPYILLWQNTEIEQMRVYWRLRPEISRQICEKTVCFQRYSGP